MKSWKKLLAVSAACSSLFFAHAEAAYTLNEEVANPPAALQMATQIGVLNYKNPDMQHRANKDSDEQRAERFLRDERQHDRHNRRHERPKCSDEFHHAPFVEMNSHIVYIRLC